MIQMAASRESMRALPQSTTSAYLRSSLTMRRLASAGRPRNERGHRLRVFNVGFELLAGVAPRFPFFARLSVWPVFFVFRAFGASSRFTSSTITTRSAHHQ